MKSRLLSPLRRRSLPQWPFAALARAPAARPTAPTRTTRRANPPTGARRLAVVTRPSSRREGTRAQSKDRRARKNKDPRRGKSTGATSGTPARRGKSWASGSSSAPAATRRARAPAAGLDRPRGPPAARTAPTELAAAHRISCARENPGAFFLHSFWRTDVKTCLSQQCCWRRPSPPPRRRESALNAAIAAAIAVVAALAGAREVPARQADASWAAYTTWAPRRAAWS